MGDEAKRTNPFLSYVEPNAIVAPEMYEKCALYGLLYTSIANDLIDQGKADAMTLDSMVAKQVADYVAIMEKLLTGAPLTDKERESEKNVRDYIKYYVPIDDPFNDDGSVNLLTRDANLAYIRDYRKNHTRVVGEMGKIIAYAKANGIQLEHGMLTRDQVELLLLAKREKCREFYDMVRANCDGKPGKIDKKDGSSKEGVHLRLYREGKNKLLKDKDKIRKESGKNALKILGSVALWGLFGASIVFTGGALSPTLAGIVGSGMSAAGVGQFFTGLVTAIFSFRGGAKLTRMASDGVKANYKRRKDLKEFMGPKINPEDLDSLLANYGKESKDLTFNERKALLMFDKAAKMYFEKGTVEGEFDGEPLAKYLPQELIDKYKYAEDARRFRLVSEKGQLYDRMFLKLPNEPTTLVGDGTMGRSDVRSLYNKVIGNPNATLGDIRLAIEEAEIALKNQKIPERIRNEYVLNLGKKVGDATVSAFLDGATSVGFADKIQKTIADTPAFSTAVGMDTDTKLNIENSYAYYQTVQGDEYDNPLMLDLGVSVTAQLSFDKNSMVAASKAIPGVTLDPAHEATVDTIANAIASLSSADGDRYDDTATPPIFIAVDNVSVIESQIRTLEAGGVDPKVTGYLTHMLNKKKKTVSSSVDGMARRLDVAKGGTPSTIRPVGAVYNVADAISKLTLDSSGSVVGVVTGYTTVDEAKKTIMAFADADLTSDQKAAAVALLEEKIQALEAKKRTDTLQNSIETINASKKSPVEMKDFQEKLDKINFKAIEDGVVDGMTFDGLMKKYVVKGTFAEYNKQLFQNAVYKAIVEELTEDNYNNNMEAGIKLLRKIKSLEGKKYLTNGQAMQLIKILEPYLAHSITEQIDLFQKDLFQKGTASEFDKLYKVLNQLQTQSITAKENAGLKEYLESNTPESMKLAQQIKNIVEFGTTRALIISDDKVTDVDLLDYEGRNFSKIYFSKDRDVDNDEMLNIIRMMSQASKNHQPSQYDIANDSVTFDPANPTVPDHNKNVYIRDMLSALKEIEIKASSGDISNDEAYAACLIAKKRIIAMYKSYIQSIIENQVGGVQDFYKLTEGSANSYLRRADRLEPLFKEVDRLGIKYQSANYQYREIHGLIAKPTKRTANEYSNAPGMYL